MSRITTVSPENAEGAIKEAYEFYKEKIGIIPTPMKMMSASPALFETFVKRIEYYSSHPTLSFALLAHIRYLSAYNLSYSFCTDFNKLILKKVGLEDKDIEKMEKDPSQSLLEENENAMLAFVIKSIKAPGSITDEEFVQLKEYGWKDSDIVDALAQGVSMIDHSIMMEVFQMDQACLV
ncbi:MAG: hypothetical protein GY707_18285 [Desulfobacteraceae bacterium]|nr:hypothetical protein [Desulfobacteraceae bacterium]